MNLKPLAGLKIIDLSTRLPGPLSTKILSDLGASVLKIEDASYGDPFNHPELSKLNTNLSSWYEALNTDKEILRLDFSDDETPHKIQSIISDADGIIVGINKKLQLKLGLDLLNLKTKKICSVIEIKSQLNNEHAMHDLNILAQSHLLNLYLHDKKEDIEAPPFLPVAGINFAQSIATTFLAHFYEAKETNKNTYGICYLDESIKKSLAIFFDLERPVYKSLHNGLFPCYNLYKTKDKNYVALAAVEERFWFEFLSLFNLPLDLDRFNTNPNKVFKDLKNLFGSKTLGEIRQIAGEHDLCLSFIELD